MFWTLPTIMTWTRIVAIPLIVGVFSAPLEPQTQNLIATVMFIAFAITDWLDTHPDHADAPSVAATAHRIKMMLDFGAPYLGFGLYLFRKG